MARITNTIKNQHFQTSHFEKGPDNRNRRRSEHVYFKKWRFFKYFAETLAMCEKRGLPPPLPKRGSPPVFVETVSLENEEPKMKLESSTGHTGQASRGRPGLSLEEQRRILSSEVAKKLQDLS